METSKFILNKKQIIATIIFIPIAIILIYLSITTNYNFNL